MNCDIDIEILISRKEEATTAEASERVAAIAAEAVSTASTAVINSSSRRRI
jgi:hypothetical protein